MRPLHAAIAAAAALLLLAGCSSTVGGSAVAGSTAATSLAPPTSSATGGAGPGTTSALPSLSISIPQQLSSDTASPTQDETTVQSSGTPTLTTENRTPETSSTTPTAVTTTVVSTPSTPSTPSTTGTTSSSGSDPFAGATPVDPADYAGFVTPVGFLMPSGNIGCGFQPTKNPDVVCQIQHHTYPNPKACIDGPTGGSVDLSAGGTASFTCYSDLESGGPTLGYGKMITITTLSCVSRENGVTCRDSATGNSFRLATSSYEFVNGGKTSSATAAPTTASSLSKFSGAWGGHGRSIEFGSSGKGIATYRSYVWCSDDPNPPCDATKGNSIIAGGKLAITLTSASAKGAGFVGTGTITSSNDPAHPTGEPVTATIAGYNLSLSIWPDSPFCAPDTPADKWNCGA